MAKGATEIDGHSLRERRTNSKPDIPLTNNVQADEGVSGGMGLESNSGDSFQQNAMNPNRTARESKSSVGTNKSSNANSDVSTWNTSAATDMSYMFTNATSANPNMSNWNFANVTTFARNV